MLSSANMNSIYQKKENDLLKLSLAMSAITKYNIATRLHIPTKKIVIKNSMNGYFFILIYFLTSKSI